MSLLPELDPEPTPEPKRWTERMMLDLIHERHSIARGGNGPRYVVAEHVRNEAGFGRFDPDFKVLPGTNGYRRTTLRTADAIAVDLWPSSDNLVHGFEVKVSRSDWLTELRDPTKADAFRRYCDHWWLVVPDAKIAHDGVPDGWGLLAVGRDGRLRVRTKAPRLEREPMPPTFVASLLRATVRTAERRAR